MCNVASLGILGFPTVAVVDGTTVYDTETGRRIGNPSSGGITLTDIDGIQRHLSMDKVLKVAKAPWNIGVSCVNLCFIGFSRYYITIDGNVFGLRNMDYVEPQLTKDGYRQVRMYSDSGDYQAMRVCRLVALAYVRNEDGRDTVDHINHIRTDDRACNLRWCWLWENIDNRNTPNTPNEALIRSICEELASGLTEMQVVRKLNVPRHIVKGIREGSHYRISRDYSFAMTNRGRRIPVEFSKGVIGNHGQSTRTSPMQLPW